jgi:hypothetical protein
MAQCLVAVEEAAVLQQVFRRLMGLFDFVGLVDLRKRNCGFGVFRDRFVVN